jgi:hypothetical protein
MRRVLSEAKRVPSETSRDTSATAESPLSFRLIAPPLFGSLDQRALPNQDCFPCIDLVAGFRSLCGVEFLSRGRVARCSRRRFSHYSRFAVAFFSSPS